MTKLTQNEELLMIAIWKVGEGHVKAYMEKMENPGPYTTVASTIKNLEKKGFIAGRLFGNTYVYKPVLSESDYKKKFLGNVVKDYFSNSYKELVNFFVDQKKLSAQELKEIVKLIESGKKSK
ncbi:MAG TPA: BlaI/MecI/CopY family transcriptional regulator [Niabella sp.]|nr:BlaI/MecI/CopY family transcriptional regulator [Niabella sp.]HQW14938.1 BlaI/MecI/CopY family transcriptional regulator [Niabella sp.]HQX20170.1 BlaI/MecI/CopY family transcriptional regulator [Niabella sp.]HQX41926.1 BlaI/MecI/CopY family transcriptional regulator [Niabella sp.]HRB06775.1 BlaI/MecI/CopY family transcriptional regulator [Niabella sp.]